MMLCKRTVLPSLTLLSFLFAASGAVAADIDASRIFKAKCKMCHGDDGDGKTPMGEKLGAKDLGSAEVQVKTDEVLNATIANGREKMPKFGEKLSAEEIKAVVGFVRTLARSK